MIAKIISGGSFTRCVAYVLNKEGVEILSSNAVRDYDPSLAAEDFKRISNQNKSIKSPVIHIPISFHRNDSEKLTNAHMKEIAQKVITDMGYANSQYLVVKHTDQPHPHFHIVCNRVDLDGKTVKDSYCKLKLMTIRKEIERLYPQLTPANTKDGNSIRKERLRGNDAIRMKIYDSINLEINNSKSIEDLIHCLKKHGIETELKFKRGSITEVQGIKFRCDNVWITGSKVDRNFSYAKLISAIEKNRVMAKSLPSLPATKNQNFSKQIVLSKARIPQGSISNSTEFIDELIEDKSKRSRSI